MDKWIKKLSGAMIASLLALTLSTKASAEGEPPAASGEGDGVLILGDAPADLAKDIEASDDTGDTGGETDSDTDQAESAYILIDGVEIDDLEDPVFQNNESHGVSPNPDEATDGYWGYDTGDSEALSDDSLYLMDYTAGSVEVHNCDLHITSAGVNQIGTIDASTGGDVYVAGTGIMLIDEVYLSEGKGFYLQPIEGLYDSGTVAVFVNTSAGCLSDLAHHIEDLSSYMTDENTGEYLMVNGSMKGILDDDYVLPDGISLIMPSGCNIEMMSPGTFNGEGGESVDLPESDDPEHPYSIGDACSQTFLSSSSLTIPTSSSLTVDEGATLNLDGRDITAPLTVSKETVTYAPVLNVKGNLINNGSITGKGIVIRSTHEDAPAVPNLQADEPEYIKPSFPDADSSTIGSGIFVIYRWNEDIIRFTYLDHELYNYLDNLNKNGQFSDDDFDTVTSSAGVEDYRAFGSDRWGIHAPLFSFRTSGTSAVNTGPIYRYTEDPTNPGYVKPIYVYGDVLSFQKMVSFNSLNSVFRFQWGIETLGMGGGDFEDDFIPGITGVGKIGSGAGDYKGDMDKSKLIFGSGGSGYLSTAANHSLVLVVTDKETCYNLAAYYDGKQIFSLASKVTVRFDYPAPDSTGRFFVVFRNGNGSLTAFSARFDSLSGQLVFTGDKLGDFVVVCIDYDGDLYTEKFYDYLETIDSVKALKNNF